MGKNTSDTSSSSQSPETPKYFMKVIAYITSAFAFMSIMSGLLDWVFGGDPITRFLILPIIFIVAIIGIWIYNNYQSITDQPPKLYIFFFLPITIGLILSLSYYIYSFQVIEASYVAPGLRRVLRGLPTASNYGTNAAVIEDKVYRTSDPIGPNYFLRLKIQMFCDEQDVDCNGGWILANLQGYNANPHTNLVLEVRGKTGGEQFGLGIKDTKNTEVKIFNINEYVKTTENVTTGWETVSVPLTDFRSRNIDLSSLDNLSIFVDARHTDQRLFEFDIASIRFE